MPPSKQRAVEQLIASHQTGYALDQAFYVSPEVYQREIDTIYLKHWLFAGHDSQIPNSGDFFTFEFDTESIIVIRDKDNSIHAHMNVCRHRGSRLCLDKTGTVKLLSCPYHAWSYNLSGELIAARNMPADFERANHSLHKVHVELVGGLIFICLAPEPPSLAPMRNDLDEVLQHYGFDALKIAEQKSYRIPANWKLAVENYQECYHCAPSHQEFAQVHAMARAPDEFKQLKTEFWQAHKNDLKFQQHNYYFDLAPSACEGYQYDRNPLLKGCVSGSLGGAAVAPLLGDISAYDGGASELMIGPVNFFLLYDDHILGYRFLPLSLDECACDVFWLVREDAEQDKDYALDTLTWLWDTTTQADKAIIMNNQKGVSSRFYRPGRLAEMEHFQQSFLNWYLTNLNKVNDNEVCDK